MVTSSPAFLIGVLIATVAGLWFGARLLVDGAVRFARQVGLSELTIGLTIVAVGTSTPELVVTTDSALAGLGDVAIGNVVGSNIYNLAFILGVVSLIRFIPVERSLVHRDGLALVASTLVGIGVMFDLTVTRAEGALLAGLMVAYTAYLLWTEGDGETSGAAVGPTDPSGGASDRPDEGADRPGDAAVLTERSEFRPRDGVLALVGLVVILVSGHFMVGAASELARGVGVSEWVIGGTIVAAGTSTPEFAVSLVALRRGSVGVSVGNIVGSNVFNMLGVVGFAAVLRPLSFGGAAIESLLWLLAVSVAMVAALWSRKRLSRPEGALFAGSEIARWVLGLLG